MGDPTPTSGTRGQPERVWLPAILRSRDERRTLRYVVVDEIESHLVGLSVSDWPTIDDVGRLRFGSKRARSVGALRSDLERFLARHRLPRPGSRRAVRIGDVFAVAVKEPVPTGETADPAAWIDPPLYDVTAEARDAAKAAFYSAVAPTLDPAKDKEIIDEAARKARS